MKKKNIALLLPVLSGGGAERTASELSRFLEREGHNVFVFTEKRYTDYEYAGRIVILRPEKMQSGLGKDIVDLYYLACEIKRKKKEFGIEVSISFMEKYNLANILSKRKEKVIIRICTILSARKDLKGFYHNRFILNKLYNRADEVIVLSRYGKRDMIQNYGIKRSKLNLIPNAVINRDFDKNIPWGYGEKVILNVNKINPIKQQGILIDAFEKIAKRIPEARLVLVGDDRTRYAAGLKKKVIKLGLSGRVSFVGRVQNVEYYMNNSQLFVITSKVEGFSNVIIEAMNQGMPIVSSDFPGAPRDILGVSAQLGYGRYGVVVPLIDEDEGAAEYENKVRDLSDTMAELLTNRELSQYYSRQAKKRAEYYNKEKIETLWKRII